MGQGESCDNSRALFLALFVPLAVHSNLAILLVGTLRFLLEREFVLPPTGSLRFVESRLWGTLAPQHFMMKRRENQS
jgi:hypothetical protein